MEAADEGYEACVKALLRAKANPDLQDISGDTALMVAAQEAHEACVKTLLRAKANTELLDKDGHTALQHAEIKGHTAPLQPSSGSTPRRRRLPPPPHRTLASLRKALPPPCPSRYTGGRGWVSCRRWSSGCARGGWSTRSALLQLLKVSPLPKPCCTPHRATANWRLSGSC